MLSGKLLICEQIFKLSQCGIILFEYSGPFYPIVVPYCPKALGKCALSRLKVAAPVIYIIVTRNAFKQLFCPCFNMCNLSLWENGSKDVE